MTDTAWAITNTIIKSPTSASIQFCWDLSKTSISIIITPPVSARWSKARVLTRFSKRKDYLPFWFQIIPDSSFYSPSKATVDNPIWNCIRSTIIQDFVNMLVTNITYDYSSFIGQTGNWNNSNKSLITINISLNIRKSFTPLC